MTASFISTTLDEAELWKGGKIVEQWQKRKYFQNTVNH
jgi:hypothetical protein